MVSADPAHATAHAAPLVVRAWTPIPAVPPADHGGLKLDATSALGRAGVLLDWTMPEPPVDAGMPPTVARMFAEALCGIADASEAASEGATGRRSGRVIGCVIGCTDAVPATADATWREVPGGAACRVRAADRPWWRGRGRDVGLLASDQPAVIAPLFDDDAFAWAHETQLLLLARAAPHAAALPPLDLAFVAGACAVPLAVSAGDLAALGVVGLLRAGVDGAVAGLYVPDPAARRAVLDAIAAATRAAGARWEERDGATHPIVAAAARG